MATHAPITGAQTRAPLFAVPVSGSPERHLHLTATPPRVANRRDLLCFAGAATALGAAVVAGGAVVASEALTALDAAPTPFAIAHRAYRAATDRFNALPDDLETVDPEAYDHEAALHNAADDALQQAPIADLYEFTAAFVALFDGGGLPFRETINQMVADAKRLTGAA